MVIEVAGVTAEVCLRYKENERHYEGYITDKPPVLTIAPTDEDIHNMQAFADKRAERMGWPPELLAEEYAIYNALCKALIDRDVLTMHGSALCMDGEAYIFAAKSGTGKSTHSRYWREVYGNRVWMISDDRPFLKITDHGVMVYGNPWNDKRFPGRNASAPLQEAISSLRCKIRDLGLGSSFKSAKKTGMRLNYYMADNMDESITIMPDGWFYNCDHFQTRQSWGNIFDGVTDSALFEALRRPYGIDPDCAKCPFLPQCTPFKRRGCVANSAIAEECRLFQRLETEDVLHQLLRGTLTEEEADDEDDDDDLPL